MALVAALALAVWMVVSLMRYGLYPSDSASRGPGPMILMLPIGFTVLIFILAVKWRRSAVSSATVDVDGARLRVEPEGIVGVLAASREIPLDDVDYVASHAELEMTTEQETLRETYRWYAIHTYLRSGERVPLAAFARREHALFVAQRVHALVERAHALARSARPRARRASARARGNRPRPAPVHAAALPVIAHLCPCCHIPSTCLARTARLARAA